MDFTVNTYKRLLDTLIRADYSFQTFTEFLEKPAGRVILLRHDVDARKLNSLHFAQIQYERGIRGTYYFRMVPQSYDAEVIRKIAEMGHEIGYHYEDMDLASSKLEVGSSRLEEKELYDVAIEIFEKNLKKLRELYPVKTICMHGSPRSKFDNKALWKKFNYRDFGIIGEPYFDLDFNKVLYLTDTGRMWDGEKVSIRDKVKNQEPVFHSTRKIIRAAEAGSLPDKIMFTFHPQRWTGHPGRWLWELLFQNLKNQVKRVIVAKRKG